MESVEARAVEKFSAAQNGPSEPPVGCGFINATTAIHHSIPVGAMMYATGVLLLIGVLVDIYLLMKVHRIYRMAGASFEKAQGEFARGVASNKQVQNVATEAAASGMRSALAGDNRK